MDSALDAVALGRPRGRRCPQASTINNYGGGSDGPPTRVSLAICFRDHFTFKNTTSNPKIKSVVDSGSSASPAYSFMGSSENLSDLPKIPF